MAKRIGVCKNYDACSKADEKVKQEVDKSAPFVCEECGKPLTEVPTAPGPGWKKIAIAIAGVAVLGTAGYFGYSAMSGDKPTKSPQPDTTVVAQPEPQKPESETEVPMAGVTSITDALASGTLQDNGNGTGKISTPFGNYEGELKDGKAEGNGTFRFFKSCLISDKDEQKRVGESGDYISGQFSANRLVSWKWFGKDGSQKGALIIGQTGL